MSHPAYRGIVTAIFNCFWYVTFSCSQIKCWLYIQVYRIYSRQWCSSRKCQHSRKRIMENYRLGSVTVRMHHLLRRIYSTRISTMAIRKRQARASQSNSYQVPRRRQPRQWMGQAST
jgi:hypothetical protein